MKFTYSWLLRHLETDQSVDEIAHALTFLGLEVERLDNYGESFKNFKIGCIEQVEKHPHADRLWVCKVNVGDALLTIICGAPNVAKGLKVAVAQPGDVIPKTKIRLKKGNIRGIESEGMMCSRDELCAGADSSGILELDSQARVGESLDTVLWVDPVFEIAVTPNRPDCLGVRGIARDLAAKGLGKLKSLDIPNILEEGDCGIAMDLQSSQTLLVAGRVISDVQNGSSPSWMRDLLSAIGCHPKSILVDITNFIGYDLGRPLHVFDVKKLRGNRLTFSEDVQGELAALDGNTYPLSHGMTVISDAVGPVSIAGIMGGMVSGCWEETTEVFIESAYFLPLGIAQTGRKLNIMSEARYRFERGVDPQLTVDGLAYATALVQKYCGGKASKSVVCGKMPQNCVSIGFGMDLFFKKTNVVVEACQAKGILRKLGFEIREDQNSFKGEIEPREKSNEMLWDMIVRPPSWRSDISIADDVVEEILRIIGFDALKEEDLPDFKNHNEQDVSHSNAYHERCFVRQVCALRGYSECKTWSFCSDRESAFFTGIEVDKALYLKNPIIAHFNCMRGSLYPHLLEAVERNIHRGEGEVAFFEYGPCFFREQDQYIQKDRITGVRALPKKIKHWTYPPLFSLYNLKEDVLKILEALSLKVSSFVLSQKNKDLSEIYHPGRSAVFKQGKEVLAIFGQLHPQALKSYKITETVYGFEIFPDRRKQSLKKKKSVTRPGIYAPNDLQVSVRDFAFFVPVDIAAQDFINALYQAHKTIVDICVFDVYQGETVELGQKGLALSVRLRPLKSTFTEEELEHISLQVIACAQKFCGARLRVGHL